MSRAGRIRRRLWTEFRGSPLTYVWLVILLVTTVVQHVLTPRELDHVLGARSTNLHHLAADPLRVLCTSLFWIDGAYWFPYLVFFLLIHRPAERWLGSVRWFLVGFGGHVIATYLSQGLLAIAIRTGDSRATMVNVLDVGVSYFLATIAGILLYRIAFPWRWVYLAALVVVFVTPLFADRTFVAIGHAVAMLVGLVAYPVARARHTAPWAPTHQIAAARRRFRRAPDGTQQV